jgi:hypothetical protein
MSRGDVLKLRETALDAGLELAQCTEAVNKAKDALGLARGNYDRAQVAYQQASSAAQKAEAALISPDAKVASEASASKD